MYRTSGEATYGSDTVCVFFTTVAVLYKSLCPHIFIFTSGTVLEIVCTVELSEQVLQQVGGCMYHPNILNLTYFFLQT